MSRLAKSADGSDGYRLETDEAANGSVVERTNFDVEVRSATFEFLCSAEQLFGGSDHLFWLESKFPLEFLQRSGSSERSHANDPALASNVTLPPKGRGLLNSEASGHFWRKNAVTVFLRLMLKNFPGRHRNNARTDALGNKLFVSLDGETQLTASRDQNELGIAVWSVGKYIRAFSHTRCRRVFGAVQSGQRLTRKCQHGRLVPQLQDIS